MGDKDSRSERVSPAFRTTLRRELDDWVSEGVVDSDQSAAISKRYRLNEETQKSGGMVVQALYLIGACLIGGGAISFVASRWEEIPVPVRMALLFSTLLAFEVAGFYLWKVSGTRKKLGEALVVLGGLVFGANVVLIAQMFNLHGEPYGAFGIWAIGAGVIAFAMMSGPCMLLTCVTSFVWFVGHTEGNPHSFCWYPLVIVAAGLPFLKRYSNSAFAGVILAAGAAIPVCAGLDSGEGWPAVLAVSVIAALLYGLGLRLEGIESARLMGVIARTLGMAGILLLAYMMSFREVATELMERPWQSTGLLWTVPFGLVCVAGVAVWISVIRKPSARDDLRHRSKAVLLAGVLLACGTLTMQPVGFTLAAHLAVAAIGISLLYTAVKIHRRISFWTGLLLLAWVIFQNFIQWDTNLLLKSMVFIACGIGVILGGIRFERHLKQGGADDG